MSITALKHKTILRSEWKNILDCSYAETRFEKAGFSGIAGLLRMDRAREQRVGEARLKIVSEGYCWLQLAPESFNAWATVMFDDKGNVFQCYFDITLENTLVPGGKSCFTDLLLDAVIRPDRDGAELFDKDELDEALTAGVINASEYELANRSLNALLEFILPNKTAFFEYCTELYKTLKPKLKRI